MDFWLVIPPQLSATTSGLVITVMLFGYPFEAQCDRTLKAGQTPAALGITNDQCLSLGIRCSNPNFWPSDAPGNIHLAVYGLPVQGRRNRVESQQMNRPGRAGPGQTPSIATDRAGCTYREISAGSFLRNFRVRSGSSVPGRNEVYPRLTSVGLET